MKLPVLESIISGECYEDVPFECSPNFRGYLEKINPNDFDTDNPFGFGCEFNDLCSRGANFSAKNRMSGYDSISVTDDIKLRRDERIEIEGINLELNLLCQQLYYFENDYDNRAELKIMVIETFEALCGYRYKFSSVNIRNAFGIFVFRFYFQYRDYLKEWEGKTARNKRLVNEIIECRCVNVYICNIQQDIDSMNGMMQNRIFSPHLVNSLDTFVRRANVYMDNQQKEKDRMFESMLYEYTETIRILSNYVICLVFLGSNIVNEIKINREEISFYYDEWISEVDAEITEKLEAYILRNGYMGAIKVLHHEWEQKYCVCNVMANDLFVRPNLYERIMKKLNNWLSSELSGYRPMLEDTDCLDEKSPTFEDIVNMRIIDNRELNIEWVGDGPIKKISWIPEKDKGLCVDYKYFQKIEDLAHQYLGMLDWEYDEGKRFISKEDFIYLVGVFARLLSVGWSPDGMREIKMLNKKSYNFVTGCIYDAYMSESIKNKEIKMNDYVTFCQKLFPKRKFKRGDFSQKPSKYDTYLSKYKKQIGK